MSLEAQAEPFPQHPLYCDSCSSSCCVTFSSKTDTGEFKILVEDYVKQKFLFLVLYVFLMVSVGSDSLDRCYMSTWWGISIVRSHNTQINLKKNDERIFPLNHNMK